MIPVFVRLMLVLAQLSHRCMATMQMQQHNSAGNGLTCKNHPLDDVVGLGLSFVLSFGQFAQTTLLTTVYDKVWPYPR